MSLGERSRTFRKKTKRKNAQIKHRNKKLVSKYPWLARVSWNTGYPIRDKTYKYISLWDDLPEGWISAFGRMMCDEIQKSLEKEHLENEVYIEQAKEKYGQLRIYMQGTSETYNIISIYEFISENVCYKCGRPHVPMLNMSWISPYCKKCYNKIMNRNVEKGYIKSFRPYEDCASKDKEHWRIANSITRKRFSTEGDTEVTIDISDRVKAIEDLWNKRHPNDKVGGEE